MNFRLVYVLVVWAIPNTYPPFFLPEVSKQPCPVPHVLPIQKRTFSKPLPEVWNESAGKV